MAKRHAFSLLLGSVTAWSATTQSPGQLWQRTDLKQPQELVPISEAHLAVLREGPAEVVDAATGESLRRLRGITSLFPTADRTHVITFERGTRRVALRDADAFKPRWKATLDTFGVLNAVATERQVIISTATQSVHTYDRESGEPLWDDRSDGWNVVDIGLHESCSIIFVSNYLGGDRFGADTSKVSVVNAATGHVKSATTSAHVHDCAFIPGGEGLVVARSPRDGVIDADVLSPDGSERLWRVHSGTHPTDRAASLAKLQAISRRASTS